MEEAREPVQLADDSNFVIHLSHGFHNQVG